MNTYEFGFVLSGIHPDSQEDVDALFEEGCDDAVFGMSNGVVQIHFAREAENLGLAIMSAINDLDAIGAVVEEILPPDAEKPENPAKPSE